MKLAMQIVTISKNNPRPQTQSFLARQFGFQHGLDVPHGLYWAVSVYPWPS